MYPGFGRIVVGGVEYGHDVLIEGGRVRSRKKRASRRLKGTYGHTPLSELEDIPWSHPRLLIGSGYSGRLPITPGSREEAERRGVALEVMPTAEACALLRDADDSDLNAVLHVTC